MASERRRERIRRLLLDTIVTETAPGVFEWTTGRFAWSYTGAKHGHLLLAPTEFGAGATREFSTINEALAYSHGFERGVEALGKIPWS